MLLRFLPLILLKALVMTRVWHTSERKRHQV
nr:unnamed protein product [Callosobruchus chinensis]